MLEKSSHYNLELSRDVRKTNDIMFAFIYNEMAINLNVFKVLMENEISVLQMALVLSA